MFFMFLFSDSADETRNGMCSANRGARSPRLGEALLYETNQPPSNGEGMIVRSNRYDICYLLSQFMCLRMNLG